jgi:8-oxo-dGTP pyrophosphatase MutT (NUDIX family)
MPTTNPAQERLMQAACHTPKGFGGVPQSVGCEFVGKSPKRNDMTQLNKELQGVYAELSKIKEDSEAWTKKEGKNKEGGLNEKGRESYNKEHGAHLKRPQPEGGARKKSFCARMKGMKSKLTSEKTAHDPDSRINKSLRKWKCDESMIDADDPCWEGYEQFGMKEKDGKKVPNCVKADFEPEGITHPTPYPTDPLGGPTTRAAGIMFEAHDGTILMLRRGNGGDFPFHFAIPGGHLNGTETAEEAARREVHEETGFLYEGDLIPVHDNGQFIAFYAADPIPKFTPKLNYESDGFVWTEPNNLPMPIHPGDIDAFKVAAADTELDVARLIAEDILPSPQPFANMHLLAIRITGTGLAYRSAIEEHVWRDPSLYMNDEFLQRCYGLTVIMDHPDGSILDSKEFKDRAIGSILLPYFKGPDEVWGIAKIYDSAAMKEISEGDISTSPSVVFDERSGNTNLITESGDPLLIEGKPFLLDHIAIVTKARGSKGVWDKGGPATGVLLNNPEVSDMNETTQPKADAAGDKLDAILNAIQNISARVDAMEKNLPAEPMTHIAAGKADDEAKHKVRSYVRGGADAKSDNEEEMMAADKKHRKDDDEEMMAADKKRKDDDDDSRKDDDDEEEEKSHKMMAADKKKRKDAAGSNPKEHGPAGEMKPDDDDCYSDDDDDDDRAKKADEEEAEKADAQAKADSVYSAFGKAASRPLIGEGLMAYRKRLLRGLQAHSDSYKGIDLRGIKDKALLALAEKQIFADAMVAARTDNQAGAGQLIEIEERDRAGRTITKFKGDVNSWLESFTVPAQRVVAFNTQNRK